MRSPLPRTLLALVVGAVITATVLFAQEPAPPPRNAGEPLTSQSDEPREYDQKLVSKPTPVPDRIILTWAGDPATSQAVTWRTDTSVAAGKAVAQLALAEGGPGFDPTWGRKAFKRKS